MANQLYADNSKPAPVPPAPCNPSAFGSIEDAARTASDAAARVKHFVDRLCGHEPETAGHSDASPIPNGLLSEAQDRTDSIRASMGRIFADMERLERRLP
jgi:hypothetical protein